MMENWFTPHMRDVYQHETSHDFMAYGYVSALIDQYDLQDEAQIDKAFDLLHSTDMFDLSPNEDILIDILDRI